jgi:hypothetical protein
VAANPVTGFERLYQPWVLVDTSNSPLTLVGTATGNAYECDCTLGNLTVYLPAISGCQTGTGFTFKKIDASSHTVTVVPNGTETIDGVNASVVIGAQSMAVGVTNDSAQWLATLFAAMPYMLAGQSQAVTANSGTLTIDMRLGWHVRLSLTHNVDTAFTVTHWPAAGSVGRLTLDITNGGSYNITHWPGSTGTVWSGGVAPTITSGSSKLDTIILTSADGGAVIRGFVASQNMS